MKKKISFVLLSGGAWFVLLSIYISIVVVLDKTQPFTSADPGGVGWGGVGCWAEGGGGGGEGGGEGVIYKLYGFP